MLTSEIQEPSDQELLGMSKDTLQDQVTFLRTLASKAETEAEGRAVISRIARLIRRYKQQHGIGHDASPIALARRIDPMYRSRPHLDLISDEIQKAVRDAERGNEVRMVVSMPPRAGKSTLISKFTPLWLLQRHPEWKIVMTSHDGGLVTSWAREVRTNIEDHPNIGISLKRDGGAGGTWQTTDGGGMYSVGVGGSLTGRGARVLIIDDPIADFVAAHSPRIRQNLWNWWLSVAQTRLEPPSIVLVVMTRWHEDDFVGRLLSKEHEGEPSDWRQVVLPALADNAVTDILDREEGDPLYSPLIEEESKYQAIERWEHTKQAVGTYTFSAMYQQRPAPQKGAIFDTSWWKFWTTDPARATEDGRIVYLDPDGLQGARWLDSWDCTFKGAQGSDYVVGQRWANQGANRYLIAQKRGRWSFTQTIEQMEKWSEQNPSTNRYGYHVHERVIEDTANGPAIIDVLKNKISGIKPVNPRMSKEGRARAVTPEIESGNVYLPHPLDPGNEWVNDLLSELRNFPYDAHDDQVDALTQALAQFRPAGRASITVPGERQNAIMQGAAAGPRSQSNLWRGQSSPVRRRGV